MSDLRVTTKSIRERPTWKMKLGRTGTVTTSFTRFIGVLVVLSLFTSVCSQAAERVSKVETGASTLVTNVSLSEGVSVGGGFTLPASLAAQFPLAQAYCSMGPENLTINKTQWQAYACSDYRSLILVRPSTEDGTYFFTVTVSNGSVVFRGAGNGSVKAIANTEKSLKLLKTGGLVDMTASVAEAWRMNHKN